MADEIKITLFGDNHFIRKLRAIRFRSHDLGPVLRDIADDWSSIIDDQFETEGRRSGRPWAQLQPSTISRRQSAHPILIDSGDMFESLGRDNIHVGDDSITIFFGESLQGRKAEAHQYGFHNALTGTEVPARPIVDFTDLDKDLFRNKIRRYLIHGDRGAGELL